ncbi:MAG: hypothetical protein ACYCZB_15745 [Acidiphilium sp.]
MAAAGISSVSLAFADATEIALIDVDFTGKKRRVLGQFGGDDLAQFVEYRGIAVLRWTPTSSAAVRAGTPAINWIIKAR